MRRSDISHESLQQRAVDPIGLHPLEMLFHGLFREGGEDVCLPAADRHIRQRTQRASTQFIDVRVEINREGLRRGNPPRPMAPIVAWRSISLTAKPSLVSN